MRIVGKDLIIRKLYDQVTTELGLAFAIELDDVLLLIKLGRVYLRRRLQLLYDELNQPIHHSHAVDVWV